MLNAKLLGKYDLPIHIALSDESDKAKGRRSYAHYLKAHQPLVAAKVAATSWVLEKTLLDPTKSYTSREYMAGVGICTALITNMLNIKSQTLNELDEECVKQLASVEWGVPTVVNRADVRKSIYEPDDSDLKFIDYPSSSVLTLHKKWVGFEKVFESAPKLVVWTDTAVTYPMSLHGEKYAKILGRKPENREDYVQAISEWLSERFGYSLVRAAFRGRNAVYLSAAPGCYDVELGYFAEKDHESAFFL